MRMLKHVKTNKMMLASGKTEDQHWHLSSFVVLGPKVSLLHVDNKD